MSTICTPFLPSCLVAQSAPCSLGRGVDAQGSYNPASLSVAFVLTSKIPGFVSLCCRPCFFFFFRYIYSSNLSFFSSFFLSDCARRSRYRKTWLYVRRSQTQIVTAISPDVPFEVPVLVGSHSSFNTATHFPSITSRRRWQSTLVSASPISSSSPSFLFEFVHVLTHSLARVYSASVDGCSLL
jgi:hypothetical protein